MPYSAHEGKAWVIDMLLSQPREPKSFLDVGAGCGSWHDAVRPWFLDSIWTAVEVYAPYIDRFGLMLRYHHVLCGDIRTMDPLPQADVIILGDVLEHMTVPEARLVWNRSRESGARIVITSIPLGHFPQGPVDGNNYERHVSTWTDETVLDRLPGITASYKGSIVGVYIAERSDTE